MSLHVNLMEKSERRYQGRVSLRAVGVVLLFVVTIVTIISFLGISSVRIGLGSKQKDVQGTWRQIKSESSDLRRMDQAGQANRKTHLALMNSLTGERIYRYSLLTEIQKHFSVQINLNYLFVGEETGYDSKPDTVVRLAGDSAGANDGLLPVRLKRTLSKIPEIIALGGALVLKESRPEDEFWSFMLEARQDAEAGQ